MLDFLHKSFDLINLKYSITVQICAYVLDYIHLRPQKVPSVSIYRTFPFIIGQRWNTEVALELEVKVWKARNLVDRETRFFGKGVGVQGGRLLRAFFYANLDNTW